MATFLSFSATMRWMQIAGKTIRPVRQRHKLRLNIFGGTFGGPIVQNKLFFFAAYQETRQRRADQRSVSVAPVEWRNGDLSSIAMVIRDP